ncbi:hypothetical protein IIA79_08710, partial [bacterium]|nr:hypothetical protein [bacterium]
GDGAGVNTPFPREAMNFELAVDVELLDGTPESGYGVFIRDYTDDKGGLNQYRFLVYEDWCAVEQSEGGFPLALSEWAQHSAVRTSGVNRLIVRAKGENLTFFVNGVEVWHGVDEWPHSGAYGFFVSQGIRVAFDNLSFTELP